MFVLLICGFVAVGAKYSMAADVSPSPSTQQFVDLKTVKAIVSAMDATVTKGISDLAKHVKNNAGDDKRQQGIFGENSAQVARIGLEQLEALQQTLMETKKKLGHGDIL